jgi:hypothetical protein
MRHASPPLDRRSVLTLAAAAAALPMSETVHAARGGQGAGQSRSRQPFDPADPASRLQGIRKVLFANHEDLVFWWMKGSKYGIVDNVTTPFYNMEVATILRCHNEGVDRFAVTSLEIVFYTDPVTGALLERWQNPYTGEWLDMKYVPVGPTRIPYALNGPEMPKELPGARLEATHALGPVTIEGDDVWIRNDNNVVVTRTDGAGRPFLVHDWATYHARLADLENTALRSAPADVSFMDITSWPQSMRMGDRPGTRLSRCAGRKVDALGKLPVSFVALLEARFPQIARDPAAALEAGANRFER